MKLSQIKLAIYSTILFIIIILLIVPIVIISTVESVTYEGQPSVAGTYNLYGENIATQQFYSDKENLHAIGLSIRNPNLASNAEIIDDKTVDLELRDSAGNFLRSSSLSSTNIPDGAFVKFEFTPIKDSLDKEYYAVFSSGDSTQENLLGLFMTTENTTWLGELTVNDEARDTKISMVRYYNPVDKFSLVTSISKGLVTRLSNDLVFLGVYLLILSILTTNFIKLSREQ